MQAMLTPAQEALRDGVRRLLVDARHALEGWERRPEATARLEQAQADLAELFLLVVAGEYNAGKSGLINALLGARHLEQGVTPTTDAVELITHGDAPAAATGADGVRRRRVPAPLLREIQIVDTPGTNAIIRQHEALTRDFIPRADLVVFVTSADHPFTESERQFLALIRDWGKKVVVAVNKIDVVERPAEREQVEAFVRDHAAELLGEAPRVFPVSARDALRAREAGEAPDADWSAFEGWLFEYLTDAEIFRLKLGSPLGIVEKVVGEAREDVARRAALLGGDRAVLEAIDQDVAAFETRTREAIASRLEAVDNLVGALRERGEAFLDERVRLARIRALLDAERVRADFETEVVADVAQDISAQVSATIDWLIDEETARWRGVQDRLAERASAAGLRSAAPEGATGFAARRRELLAGVGEAADRELAAFDPAAESRRLGQAVQDAVAHTALLEIGAFGLAGVIIALTSLDGTGILAGSALAALGLTVLPYRRRKAAEALRARIAELRAGLRAGLTDALEREVAQAARRMRDTLAPYAAFVAEEERTLSAVDGALEALAERRRALEIAVG